MSWIAEKLQEITGYTVAPTQEVEQLRESSDRIGAFADLAEDYALTVYDYLGGRPNEMNVENRRMLSQRSRIAFIRDPLAGAEANLRANFSLGRGIPKPQAADEDVQKVIDRWWNDSNQQRKLTSFSAQRKRSNNLLATANAYPCYFEHNGQTKVAFWDEDQVTDVVTHPDDDETPLWYVVRRKESKWSFERDAPDFITPTLAPTGQEKVYYVEHWRNYADALKEAEDTGQAKPPKPPDSKLLPGRPKMEHFSINVIGRTQFGVPPWARQLRFYSAMNQLTEAQVQMRQGAASIVAKRVRKTDPKGILKGASQLIAASGELAQDAFGVGGSSPQAAGPGTVPTRGNAPPPAGSWWHENQTDRLEAVRLSSGAGEAATDAQLVRGPIAAAAGFGQHYLGDPSSTNLATASTLELPTLMEIQAWQEVLESMLRWSVDREIECAIESGALGGLVRDTPTEDTRALAELHLDEDFDELEARVGRDLSYSFEMPYPGRRNLPEVMQASGQLSSIVNLASISPRLAKFALDYALRHGFQVDDAPRVVEEVMGEVEQAIEEQKKAEAEAAAMAGGPSGPPSPGPNGGPPAAGRPRIQKDPREGDARSQYGERRQATPPRGEMGAPRRNHRAMEFYEDPELEALMNGDVEGLFQALLDDPGALIPRRNGGTAPAIPPRPPLLGH